jgi:hypothetical protein
MHEQSVSISFFRLKMRSYTQEATLIREGSTVILRVPLENDEPYLIVGTMQGPIFIGRHEGSPDDTEVRVTWAELDGSCVGFWDEEGMEREYLAFKIPDNAL